MTLLFVAPDWVLKLMHEQRPNNVFWSEYIVWPVIQIVAVVSAILAHRWYEWNFWGFIVPVEWTAITSIYFATLVSVISAVDYFVGFWKKIDHAAADRRKTFVMTRKGGRSISPAE